MVNWNNNNKRSVALCGCRKKYLCSFGFFDKLAFVYLTEKALFVGGGFWGDEVLVFCSNNKTLKLSVRQLEIEGWLV